MSNLKTGNAFFRGIFFFFLGLFAANHTHAQVVTLFEKPFDNVAPNGTMSGHGTGLGGTQIPWSAGTPWQCDNATDPFESPFTDLCGDGILDANGSLYHWGVWSDFNGNNQFLVSDVEGQCCRINTGVTSGDNQSEINFGPIPVAGYSLIFNDDFITVNFNDPSNNSFSAMSGVQNFGCEPNEFDQNACKQNGSQLAVYVSFDGAEQLYKVYGGNSSCSPSAFDPCIENVNEVSIRIVVGNQEDDDFYGIENIILRGSQGTQANCFSGVKILAQVALEGVTTNGLMSTNLVASNLLPSSQPYSPAPFNHSGTESASNLGSNIVDWVLVELRSSTLPSQVMHRKAALLRNDGMLVDPDGSLGVNFDSAAAGNYFVSINHRNHLGIMSAAAINLPNANTYNFTSSPSMVSGVNQMVNINSIYAMRSGDIDGTGTINFLDFLAWFGVNNLLNSYNKEDCDMTGTTNFLDFLQWFSNNNSLAVPELQY